MKSKRRALGVGLITALALVGGLAVATNVIGKKQQRTVINDKAGDGGGFVPRKRPGFCDIVQATSELAKEGRLRHTVTTRGPVRRKYNAPPVVITRQRVRGAIGLASFVLSPGEPKVWSHLRNHRRTIVYFVKREVIKNAVHRRDKYFWVADQCQLHDDKAPDRGSATQPLKNRHRRHR